MKKFSAALLSVILILSIGTTTVLADPEPEVMSALDEETAVSENETEESPSDQTGDPSGEESDEESETVEDAGEDSSDTTTSDEADLKELLDDLDALIEEETDSELAEEEETDKEVDEEETEVEELEVVPFSVEDYVEFIDIDEPLELKYDDRFDLSELDESISDDEKYVIYIPEDEVQNISSFKVTNGQRGKLDEALLTQKEEGSTTVIASAVGDGTVWLVRADDEKDLEDIMELEETLDTGDSDSVPLNNKISNNEILESEDTDIENLDSEDSNDEDLNNEDIDSEDSDDEDLDNENLDSRDSDDEISDIIDSGNEESGYEDLDDEGLYGKYLSENSESEESEKMKVYRIEVKVEEAPLTLMFLTGQSNMEGRCSSSTGYDRSASIACEAGTVYSTYAPSAASDGNNIAGVSESCSASNAGEFVAGSLQEGTNMSGGELVFPINTLTTEGGGKTGPDSGLAYEWNLLTGDKVWVVNTAYSGSSITSWISSGSNYQRSSAVWTDVLQTYDAEVDNHYSAGKKLVFWLQGEFDYNLAAADYESYFSNMYYSIDSALAPSAFGIIMVRASTGSYTTDADLAMTGPRIAQYWLGSGASGYPDVYVVSNVNEQWVSDDGVSSYFQNAYPGGSLSYPTHSGGSSLPGTVSAVHSDVHYSQVAHNENGITAADGMYAAINNTASATGVSWKDEDGQDITSLSFELEGDTATMVEAAEPIYTAKEVSYDYGNYASYDGSTATLTGISTGNITASYGGTTISQLSVEVSQSSDLTDIVGKNYTGFYDLDGTIWYLEDSIIQRDYEGVVKDTKKVIDSTQGWWYVNNGKLDITYTGFAHNENGWWYIEDGKVTFNKNGAVKDSSKKIDGKSDIWYVIESKVQFDFTGLSDYSLSGEWWYFENGRVTYNDYTVAKNKNGWYYVEHSKVNFDYNGFATNSNGKWYIENGKVTFNKNSVIKDTTGAIGTKGTWWYVVESKVQTDFTGLADYSNENGWWYIENGKVTFTIDTIAKNKNGWFYVKDSKVDFSFTGLADFRNENGWWYIDKGKVTFSKDTIAKNKNGWYYIKDSKVDFSFTGLADFRNENGWWYCQDGRVNFDFNGIARNKNGWYYIVNSKVDFSFTGSVTAGGRRYSVTNGKVNR